MMISANILILKYIYVIVSNLYDMTQIISYSTHLYIFGDDIVKHISIR